LPVPGRRTKSIMRIWTSLSFILLSILGFSVALPANLAPSVSDSQTVSTKQSNFSGATVSPQGVGAYPLPDLSLPRQVVSSFDSLLSSGGVINGSSDSLTLYNLAVRIRLLGGADPHDELLGRDGGEISSRLFWNVEGAVGSAWIPLHPEGSNFTLLGTNTTGTFLVRTMSIGTGELTGSLRVVYSATSDGPLKWDLEFTPSVSNHYRLVFFWHNVTGIGPGSYSGMKEFSTAYGGAHYTMSWKDVGNAYNATASVDRDGFRLWIDLGNDRPGLPVLVDPSVVAQNVTPDSTAFTFQRKLFYEPTGGRYWVFYNPCGQCGILVTNSTDGIHWSQPSQLPILFTVDSREDVNLLNIFNIGQTVFVTQGQSAQGTNGNPLSVSLAYSAYKISGRGLFPIPNLPAIPQGLSYNATCPQNYTCSIGIRYANIVLVPAPSGGSNIAFSYNRFFSDGPSIIQHSGGIFSCGIYATSALDVVPQLINRQNWTVAYSKISSPGCLPSFPGSPIYDPTPAFRSVLLQNDAGGRVRTVFQYPVYQTDAGGNDLGLDHVELRSVEVGFPTDGGAIIGPTETITTDLTSNPEFSVTADTSYSMHAIYVSSRYGTVTYSYRTASGSSWFSMYDIFAGTARYPTITVDLSTNTLYALAVQTSSIVMKARTLSQLWSDQTPVYPITNRVSPANLTSNFAAASSTSSNQILIVWTEGGRTYNAMFASIPIATVWSPYAGVGDPWDRNGIAPYGQYFAAKGEDVSLGTGMLTVEQTDISLSGRGLDLGIARVYTEPNSFFGGQPYNYEAYPWAPLGAGWQFNFPWMASSSGPSYIHLRDGEGYRIPATFWNGISSTYENHQGENFRLVRYANATIILSTKSGTSYVFGTSPNHALVLIRDATGNNTISFSYSNNLISTITDTLNRSFAFCYTGGLLTSIIQGAQCGGSNYVRRLLYSNNGISLTNVTDPDGK